MTKNQLRIIFYTLLVVFAFCMFYIKDNSAKLYSALGDINFSLNNKKIAAQCYEKSFELGNSNQIQRQRYLNILIPEKSVYLSIPLQEKLVNLAEDKIQDGISKKAEYFLEDLKYELHRKYPLNYIKQAPQNRKIIRWNKFPITYSFEAQSGVPKYFEQEIENAVNEWQKTGIVSFAQDDKAPNILIRIVNNNVTNAEYGKKYVIAYTEPSILADRLEKMTITFNTKSPDNSLFTQNQIYNTALHEIFHALGFMGHSYDKHNIMYLSKRNEDVINDARAKLTDADISTLKLLYEIKPDITNFESDDAKYIPYLILGDEEDINYSKEKEARNYIRKAPNLAGGYVDYAETLVSQKRYSEAIKILEKCLNISDNSKDTNYILYYNLAVCYFYIDNTEMADLYIKKAMQIKDTSELHYLYAENALKAKDIKAAIKEYQELVNKYPHNIDFTIGLANIYIKNYKYIDARRVLKEFIKNNPDKVKDSQFKQYKIFLL